MGNLIAKSFINSGSMGYLMGYLMGYNGNVMGTSIPSGKSAINGPFSIAM